MDILKIIAMTYKNIDGYVKVSFDGSKPFLVIKINNNMTIYPIELNKEYHFRDIFEIIEKSEVKNE